MRDANKRKFVSEGSQGSSRNGKRSNGGNGGKWQTPHQQAKVASSHSCEKIEPGDRGIWATCVRGMEGKASGELKDFFEECAEIFYGITGTDLKEIDDESGRADIEASINMEMALIKSTKSPKLFQPVYLDIQCVLFFKTCATLDPVDFVDRICKWIICNPEKKKTKYINRLTPMTLMGKATEKGLEELSIQVLSQHFNMNNYPHHKANEVVEVGKKVENFSYAIRPTIRNHSTLKRDTLIKQIATSISDLHRVNLTNPDRVIVVEIYQNICGMSVLPGGDWERLKRYNVTELYSEKRAQELVTNDEPSSQQEQSS